MKKNILFMRQSDQVQGDGEKPGLSDSTRKKLFESRQERMRPLKDDKILTIWNGLMIAASPSDGAFSTPARSHESIDPAQSAMPPIEREMYI